MDGLQSAAFVGLIAALAYQLKNGLALYLCLEKQVKQVKQDQLDPDRQIS